MEPSQLRFGGGSSETMVHPVVAVTLALVIILILCVRRKAVLWPLLVAIFCIPLGQVVVIGGVHFTPARLLIVAGLIRSVLSKKAGERYVAAGWNAIDSAFALCALITCIAFSIQYMESQALIKSLGNFLDQMGGYFVLRSLIRDREDVRCAIKALAVVAAVLGICMLNEQVIHQNIFGYLGGMSIAPSVRNGSIRSQGTFEVYITAGAFGGTLLPLLVWLRSTKTAKFASTVGMAGATLMAVTSSSSTSLLAIFAGVVGFSFWPLRKHMRVCRWMLSLTLVGLHIVMQAPVWSLIGRIDLTGSSSGYHRYMLVDNLIRHFSDWWLIGVKNYDTWGWDMWDLSNQYVAYGVSGGLFALLFFIRTISKGFGKLGTARRAVQGDSRQEWIYWCLGVALFSHVVTYFGIGYFDQMQFAWYALLAIISTVVASNHHTQGPLAQVDDYNATFPDYQPRTVSLNNA